MVEVCNGPARTEGAARGQRRRDAQARRPPLGLLAANPDRGSAKRPRPEDYVCEGYELGDALQEANETLEDDFTVSERDGHAEHVRPFTRDELLKPLEAWFFGRS